MKAYEIVVVGAASSAKLSLKADHFIIGSHGVIFRDQKGIDLGVAMNQPGTVVREKQED